MLRSRWGARAREGTRRSREWKNSYESFRNREKRQEKKNGSCRRSGITALEESDRARGKRSAPHSGKYREQFGEAPRQALDQGFWKMDGRCDGRGRLHFTGSGRHHRVSAKRTGPFDSLSARIAGN